MRKLLLVLAISGILWPAHARQSKRLLSSAELKSVVQAVEDEIYDTGNYGEFYQMGANVGSPDHWKARMHIYIDPHYDQAENVGKVIYKFMPYGEILRVFSLEKGGLVALDGDPHNRFPPTQPSHQTVYMDDEEVCKMKHDWLGRFFIVDTSPGAAVIQEAARRQKARVRGTN